MRLSLTASAAADIESIVDFLSETDPPLAKKVFAEIRAAAGRLARFPHIGRPGRVMGTRELTVPDYPYVLVYTAAPPAVTIVAVFHAARDIAGEMRRRAPR